jgi:hypothetical protein
VYSPSAEMLGNKDWARVKLCLVCLNSRSPVRMALCAARFGTEKALEPLRRVNAGGTHLLSLINEILDLSKIEAGKLELNPEPVSLTRLLDEESMPSTLQPYVMAHPVTASASARIHVEDAGADRPSCPWSQSEDRQRSRRAASPSLLHLKLAAPTSVLPVLTRHGGGVVRAAQDHACGGAGGRVMRAVEETG